MPDDSTVHGPARPWPGSRPRGPLRELPLYLRENSLLVLGPERSHVDVRPADPLTVEAFVTTEATFRLRGDGGRVELRCRQDGRGTTFEASEAPATWALRMRDAGAPTAVTDEGRPLSRVDGPALDRAEQGWTLDGGVVVIKARARELRMA